MTGPETLLSIGEAMIEFTDRGPNGWARAFAGDTLNTAWYARALLDPAGWRVAYATRVGCDRHSNEFVDFLGAHGLETRFVQRDARRHLGLYVVSLDRGERSFTYWRDDSAARGLADDPEALAPALSSARSIYCSGITLAILPPDRRRWLIDALGAATARGALTAFDPNIRPALWPDAAAMRDSMMAAAAACRLALPSFSDEVSAFGDATPEATLERYRAAGCAEIVVKNGEQTTSVLHGDEHVLLTPEPVIPVDTTGAGDSFNGAYLATRLQGGTPEQAVRQGQRIAGLVVRRFGAIVDPAEIERAG